MPINLRKDRNRPRSPLAIPTAPSRDQSPPIDELFTGFESLARVCEIPWVSADVRVTFALPYH